MSCSYQTKIVVPQSAADVLGCIANVPNWWSRDFEGRSAHMGDEFTIHHPGAHYSKQRVVDVTPDHRMVWLVTDSKLSWLHNQSEWTNTRMTFEISQSDGVSAMTFTHEGLTPMLECYNRCAQGWNTVINEWLFAYITAGQTIPRS